MLSLSDLIGLVISCHLSWARGAHRLRDARQPEASCFYVKTRSLGATTGVTTHLHITLLLLRTYGLTVE